MALLARVLHSLLIFLSYLFLCTTIVVRCSTTETTVKYCLPNEACWPSVDQWRALSKSLSKKNSLWSFSKQSFDECERFGSDAISIGEHGHGLCMMNFWCKNEACRQHARLNVPAYAAEVITVDDLKVTLAFCNEHNIMVSIKTTGHSYAGSSAMRGSLVIWMRNFQKQGAVETHTDSCGASREHVLKIGGGQVWGEAYAYVYDAGREICGGGGMTVSAAGGWLQGGGLCALSRKYGYGIDNVVAFDVVLANATAITVDECSHADLFWALRGGGGGTFAVVTAAYYKTHERVTVTSVHMYIDVTVWTYQQTKPIMEEWIRFWMTKAPTLGQKWLGGYWGFTGLPALYFEGTEEEATQDFLGDLVAWKQSLPAAQHKHVHLWSSTSADGYYAQRREECAKSPDVRACRVFGTHTDPAASFNPYSKMIPREWVTDDQGLRATRAMTKIMEIFPGGLHYFLGGAVTDVAPNATAVHPSVRKALFNVILLAQEQMQVLRQALRDTGLDGGVCYNHAGQDDELDWDAAAWGSNRNRLARIKKSYDPDARFNCFHCVGFIDVDAPGSDLVPDTCGSNTYNCFTPNPYYISPTAWFIMLAVFLGLLICGCCCWSCIYCCGGGSGGGVRQKV